MANLPSGGTAPVMAESSRMVKKLEPGLIAEVTTPAMAQASACILPTLARILDAK